MRLYAGRVPNGATTTKTTEFTADAFPTAAKAIQFAKQSGRVAILLHGGNFVTPQAHADQLAAAGIEFAYLCDHEMPDGTHRIMTVPVND